MRRVQQFFKKNRKAHLREAERELNMGRDKIWRILILKLKWKAYRPHTGQVLTDTHKVKKVDCLLVVSFAESRVLRDTGFVGDDT